MAGEGEFALVREHLEISLHSSSWWVSDLDIYALLLDMAVQQRDESGIRQYAPLEEDLAYRYGHTLYQAVVHRAWGVAERLGGNYVESGAHLNKALDLFNGLKTRWQIGRTLFEMGELASVKEDKVQAHDHFTLALEAFQEMRAAPDVKRTEEALERLK